MTTSVEIPVVDLNGKQVATYTAPASLFASEPNENAVHFSVKGERFRFYKKNACVKTRAAVRGGGKKPFKQKGTGNARMGTIRSPLAPGGGTMFGPQALKRDFAINKSLRRVALSSVLTDRLSGGQLKVVRDGLAEPKAAKVAKFLSEFQNARVAVVVDSPNAAIGKSARNLKKVDVLTREKWTTLHFVKADVLMFSESAMNELVNRFQTSAAKADQKGK